MIHHANIQVVSIWEIRPQILPGLKSRKMSLASNVVHRSGSTDGSPPISVDKKGGRITISGNDQQGFPCLGLHLLSPSEAYSISQEICTRFCCALLCCVYAIVHNEFTWSIYPYSSGLLCWHWGQSLDCHSANEVSLMDMGKSVNV